MMADYHFETLHALCPTCLQDVTFEHIGQQNWPKRVAEKLNIPAQIQLYQCCQCHTTLTHLQLEQVDA